MNKRSTKTIDRDLRPEYDLKVLKAGVRGKYHPQTTAGSNVVLIDADLVSLFPDSASVNRALRLLADTARATAGPKRRK
jgi:hypothetical protein